MVADTVSSSGKGVGYGAFRGGGVTALVVALAALKNFASISCILLLRKASVFGPKYSFSFRFISICLSIS